MCTLLCRAYQLVEGEMDVTVLKTRKAQKAGKTQNRRPMRLALVEGKSNA